MIYSTNVLIGGRGGATKSVIKEEREGGKLEETGYKGERKAEGGREGQTEGVDRNKP